MKKILFLILLLLVSWLSPAALADKVKGGGYVLYDVINSGGMTLQQGDNVLKDSKGEGIAGRSGAGNIIFTPGIFGLIATGEVVFQAPTAQLVDDGAIRQTKIVRKGNDLEITWADGPGGPYVVSIWEAAGPGEEYQASVSIFSNLGNVPTNTFKYTHLGAAVDGNNHYYRVVPTPLVPGSVDILDTKNNSITVGKVEIAVPANKFDFVALPFMEDDYLLKDVLGDQLGEGGEYYFWDANSQTNPGATFSGGNWSGLDKALNTTLRLGDGFYVRAKTSKQLTLVGRFGKLQSPFVKALKPKDKYNLIAFSYPTSKTLKNMGLILDEGADVYEWINNSEYKGSTFSGGNWSITGVDDLQINRPRFYRPIFSLQWSIDP